MDNWLIVLTGVIAVATVVYAIFAILIYIASIKFSKNKFKEKMVETNIDKVVEFHETMTPLITHVWFLADNYLDEKDKSKVQILPLTSKVFKTKTIHGIELGFFRTILRYEYIIPSQLKIKVLDVGKIYEKFYKRQNDKNAKKVIDAVDEFKKLIEKIFSFSNIDDAFDFLVGKKKTKVS